MYSEKAEDGFVVNYQMIAAAAGTVYPLVADDGIAAVDKMAYASSDCYDLILMDVQMPSMNGFLVKPINMDALMRTLADILKK